ncbi:MAG: class I SAM-dependent methyltransferase [Dehalococcoidia bacterium]
MQTRSSAKNLHARRLFDPIAPEYDLLLEALTLFQNSRWRRFLISRLHLDSDDIVLDLCTGTAGVAIDIARRHGCRVVGLDLSQGMLRRGRERVQAARTGHLIDLMQGRAEALGYRDGQFDAVAFTYLLRYVDDPAATLAEVVRVLKPGGRIASLDFCVPQSVLVKGMWTIYTRWVLPLATRFVSEGWWYVGDFLWPSIVGFYHRYSMDDLLDMWREVGISDARARTMTFGGAVVMWGNKAT